MQDKNKILDVVKALGISMETKVEGELTEIRR